MPQTIPVPEKPPTSNINLLKVGKKENKNIKTRTTSIIKQIQTMA